VDGATEYAVAFRADIRDLQLFSGWHEQGGLWQSSATGISAQGCGLLRLPSLQAVIEADDLVFDTSGAQIVTQTWDPVAKVPIPIFQPGEVAINLRATDLATTDVVGVLPDPDGRLALAAETPAELEVVDGPTNSGEFSCRTTPLTTLTTGTTRVQPEDRGPAGPPMPGKPDLAPWTLQGEPLSGPLVGARATVVGNDFALPIFPLDPADPFSPCVIFNGVFSGSDENGETYLFKRPDYGDSHPAGVSQAIGDLVITEIDEDAVQVGPPAVVPGTA
jgi:hypothetical protein